MTDLVFCDAHLHLACCGADDDCARAVSSLANYGGAHYYACTCAHDETEFARQQRLVVALTQGAPDSGGADFVQDATDAHGGGREAAPSLVRTHLVSAFGIHPQASDLSRLPLLESLLARRAIGAIGEAGFDLYTEVSTAAVAAQEEAWQAQVALSERYGVPLIVHCRKALERLFRDTSRLRRLPAVVFHSFAGNVQDARSLLRRGINGYFSFGKPLINGKKSAIACVRDLADDRLLLETDAPYQTLRDESVTSLAEIRRVYAVAAVLRECSMEVLCAQLARNFSAVFGDICMEAPPSL